MSLEYMEVVRIVQSRGGCKGVEHFGLVYVQVFFLVAFKVSCSPRYYQLFRIVAIGVFSEIGLVAVSNRCSGGDKVKGVSGGKELGAVDEVSRIIKKKRCSKCGLEGDLIYKPKWFCLLQTSPKLKGLLALGSHSV